MKNLSLRSLAIIALLIASACVVEKADSSKKPDTTAAVATPTYTADSIISVPVDSTTPDTAGLGAQLGNLPPLETDTGFTRINGKSTTATLTKFPSKIPARGAEALQLEVLLDRAGFSPGIIDGTWGVNASKALTWFRVANGMDSTGSRGDSATTTDSTPAKTKMKATAAKKSTVSTATIDQATYQKLAAAGQSTPLITTYQVTGEDVKGPFIQIPNNVYQKAKLDCLCYSSPAEELAEKFHTSEQMLKQLNPGVDLKSVTAGTAIQVPNVGENATTTSTGSVAKLVISTKGYWTHAVDASGNIIAHFPSTLGAGYDPSPTGDFHVTGISHNPSFNYQPALMAEVPDTKPTAKLKPGPNSPVGVVWVQLSKPHYGIHGTSSPETIGYANSHGCVRLTNWDAQKLSSMVKAGTPVQFE
ncbi:MAG: L,D-transpeptidase [Gemmatimonadaceae bacterium]